MISIRYTVRSLYLLARVHRTMERGKLIALRNMVQERLLNCMRTQLSLEQLCRAMEMACVLYVKPVLCLQRSAALVVLLRESGIQAEVVVGTQLMPLKAHAWVEHNNTVINDKSYIADVYKEIERF